MMKVSPEVNSLGYIVRFKSTASQTNDVTQITNKANALLRSRRPVNNVVPTINSVFHIGNLKAFSIPLISDAYVAKLLEDSANVESVELDIEVNAYAQTVPWGVSRIGTKGINAATTSTVADIDNNQEENNMNIFILDTGVSSQHPDLNLNVVDSKSFVPTERGTDDLNGHGTAVAGVAAARDNTEGVVGVCPGAKIHSYKCLDKNGRGQLSWIISAVNEVYKWRTNALNNGKLAVVNMSLGGYVGTFELTSLDIAIQQLASDTIKVPVIVAAGNSSDLAGLYTPAHTPEAITVGAYDSGNNFASFSNYGPSVDILAPGVNILTTGINTRTRKATYVTYSGTSFSAPHVAGAVALYLSLAANASSTPSQILAYFTNLANASNAAITISSSFPNTTSKSVYVGDIDLAT